MTRHRNAILIASAGAGGAAAGRLPQRERWIPVTADRPGCLDHADRAASSSTRSALAGEAAALDAVAVARAFTAAVCPYSWRDPVPYGQRLDAALARWGTPGFAAAHQWSPARIASAAAGLAERQAEQTCGQVTGGLEPEADPAAGQVAVRLSVTVTAAALDGATSTAQETFNLQLVHHGAAWLISSGQW